MNVKASEQELETWRGYLERKQERLRGIRFYRFGDRRRLREEVVKIERQISIGKVCQYTLAVPGFMVAQSYWRADKKRYFTEVNGLVCEIDEEVHTHVIQREEGADRPAIVIRETPDGELCCSITIGIAATPEDISSSILPDHPARSVFPGSYATIVEAINQCTEGLFPHERPPYLTDEVYWFYFHNEVKNFVATHRGT